MLCLFTCYYLIDYTYLHGRKGLSGTDTVVVVVGFCPVSSSWSFNLLVTTILLWPALYCCNHRPTNPIMSGNKLIISVFSYFLEDIYFWQDT